MENPTPIQAAGAIPNGIYRISNHARPTHNLTSTSVGNRAVAIKDFPALWRDKFHRQLNSYTLERVNNSLFLEQYKAMPAAANVGANEPHGEASQQWNIASVNGSNHFVVSSAAPNGFVLDLVGSGGFMLSVCAAPVVLGRKQQQWAFKSIM